MTVGVLVSPVGQPGQLPFLLGLHLHSVEWDGRAEGYLRCAGAGVCRQCLMGGFAITLADRSQERTSPSKEY